MNRIELLRLDYLFSVVVPCLLAIYIADLELSKYLGVIFGWSFIGITGNLLNDAIDKDRGLDYTTKELGTIAIISFILGITLLMESFIREPITIVLALSTILLVIGYCIKIKQYPIINKFVLVFSHIVFPYLMIRIQEPTKPITLGEIMLLLTFLVFSFSGQVIHEAIDKEAIASYSQRRVQIIVQIASIITIITGICAIILIGNYLLFPFIVVPLGPMYI
ncbi:MAG: UbiA family prenyltransferase, partial [Candidatus Helarchaeota archaeon]|nr:UbiA family prenyltransferase [Candidatus Helarchaeota archaeon]